MKKKRNLLFIIVALATILVAGAITLKKTSRKMNKTENAAAAAQTAGGDALVLLETSEGNIKVRLFGDTPKHRDNFLKLVKEGYYNGVLFHRVINEFMVQTGDPDSKNAPAGKALGAGGPDYTLEAEIVYPKHYHKRGALAAARQGDQVNPERRSSGSQFYIVTGKAYNDSTLKQMERQLQMMQKQQIFNELTKQHKDSIMAMRRNRDQAGLQKLQDELVAITEQKAAENPAALTSEQREVYATQGGTPHLDNQYTVFGEVVEGMDVVDKIEKAETDGRDRPVSDIRIISAKVVDK
ncbi:MAG: peptidylprolyl isomerase [Muribaculaceae bacterium]|jgi:peptidylprolyl isomerase/peptidyl-prolyl cis-trans isomerase B (cyclophilin B)